MNPHVKWVPMTSMVRGLFDRVLLSKAFWVFLTNWWAKHGKGRQNLEIRHLIKHYSARERDKTIESTHTCLQELRGIAAMEETIPFKNLHSREYQGHKKKVLCF